MKRAAPVAREAIASAISQPVASVLTMLMIAGMVVAVMLTTGRTVGSEQQVLGTIDSAGTRSITVRAEAGSGITSDVLDRIANIQGIEWAGAFSVAMDATNSLVRDGSRVPVRLAYGDDLSRLGIPSDVPLPGELAYASPIASTQLGLPDVAGGVSLLTGATYGVAGSVTTPDFLSGFEPLVIVPEPNATGAEPIGVIVVVAETPELVAPVAESVVSVLGSLDATKVSVQTSEALAQLRALIQDQLGSFSRGLVLALLALTGALVAVLLYGLVMMRRKDFGRRRALGATRGLIVALLLTQTAVLAIAGAALGLVGSTVALMVSGDPLPGAAFTAALGILAVAAATIAALLPALIASRREPIRELRVP